jgi:hypothetical protein
MAGFTERMTAIELKFVAGKANTTKGDLFVQYWSGETWRSAKVNKDGTFQNGASLAKSGIIEWVAPSSEKDTQRGIDGRIPLYYYRLFLRVDLSANVDIYFIGGVPAQKEIGGYKFPVLSHNRLMLCSNQDDKKNSVLIAAPATTSVFNGTESREIPFGNDEELVAGSEIFGQFGSDIYNLTLLCKKHESWMLSEQESTFEYSRVSPTIGCTAPLTMTTVNIQATETRPSISGAIFQSNDAIYLFDGREFYPVHRDIEDIFTRINKTYIDKSEGFLDKTNQEWHWLITTGVATTHNEEWVYDLKRDRWYQIDRTSYLQSGFGVEDTSGNFYNYGTLDTGYMERLENGTTFDGSDMVFSLWTGDITLTGSMMYETHARHIHLIAKSKNTTTNSISLTHYGDGATTGTSLTAMSPANTSGRLISKVKSENTGNHVFHSIKFSMTTNDETTGFEPLQFGVFYKDKREHKGIKDA